MAPTKKALENWTSEDVSRWLNENNFGEYHAQLCEEHKFDGNTLLNLTEDDLKGSPVKMNVLGDIKRIIKLVDVLRSEHCDSSFASSSKRSFGSSRSRRNGAELSEDEDVEDGRSTSAAKGGHCFSDVTRTIISVCYVVLVFLLTSFVMTVVHDRVPDMKTYPPLPDIILDNVPFIPWAFDLCEVCAILLGIMWVVVVIMHKHRLILVRRICALFGTVFLLRCFTMYVTSMSVPGVHLECSSKIYGDFKKRLSRALEIFFGMGMSLSGVRSCGDYMFSGHTSTVTLLNFFVTEYTPRRWYLLHTFCWLLNAFAVFFILAAHEHYTIDVVIAFYLSSRLFLYYHTLACAQPYLQSDRKRSRIWFPMFWFFEEDSPGRIPNEYEWPITLNRFKWLVGLITGNYNHPNKND